MNKEDKQELLKRYLAGECNAQEVARVEQWYQLLKTNDEEITESQVDRDIEEVRHKLYKAIRGKKLKKLYRYTAAAAVVCILTLGGYLYYTSTSLESADQPIAHTSTLNNDIQPGKNVAILQLEDGTEIEIDNSTQSILAHTGGNTAYINEEGQLQYKTATDINLNKPTSNTVRTPRGGQFQVTLPDGSQVWLNAASQITYSLDQQSSERVVDLQGEAYFEIAKDSKRPFKVYSNGQVIEVLGTHFNVNSYADEPGTKTSLLEGSVKITETHTGKDITLKPGQQALLSAKQQIHVSQVNIEEAIAWKNGKFNFNNANIHDITRQLSRWYNVEVIFKGKPRDIRLSGEIHRNTPASKVLEILSFYNLNCRIETVNGIQQIIIE